jgi:Carboxypeptidase regulatory-like domain
MTKTILILALTLIPAARAQQFASAGIFGNVADAQGAVMPGAKVTLIDVDRNQERSMMTNSAGEFTFPSIPVGTYRLRVENAGFRGFEQTGIVVEVNDNRKVDVVMQVGDISTKVEVAAAAAAVETANATLKSVVEGKRILELPLNGRNVASLTSLTAGVVQTGSSSGDSKNAAESITFSVNGSRQNTLKFTLDGGDNEDNLQNVNMPFPFPDAVAEFSVETSNAGVEVGKSSAGAVNVVTKSGTNTLHGNGFWFVRNTDLNAQSYFAHQSDLLKRNQAGGTLGGPVRRNKLFFFGGYQQTWIRSSPTESKTLTMPAAFRQGNFSSLLTQAKPVVVNDPLTNTPFAGNIIPQPRLSAAAAKLLAFSPVPAADGYDHWRVITPRNDREYISRLDYRLSDKHSFTARYYQNEAVNSRTIDPKDINTVSNSESTYSKNGTLGYTYVVSPSLLSETRATVARTFGIRSNDFPLTIADMGVDVHPTSNQISVSINGTSGLSISTSNPPARFARTNLELTHSWHWTHGRHNVSWGADVMTSRYNEYNTFQGSGAYNFNGRWSGFDQADFVLGQLSSFNQSNGELEYRRYHYYGFYASDSFRISRRVTLSYGLRWEPFFPITDLNDREVQFSQPDYLKGTRSTRYVNAPPGLFYPGDSPNGREIPKGGVSASHKQFAPRVGLAWDVFGDGRTSMRAGYGIFYDTAEMYVLNNMNLQAPFSFTVAFQNGLFDRPFQGRENLNVFPYSGDFQTNSPFQIPSAAVVYEPTWRQPYTQNWNYTVEHSFGSWLAQASYVGTKSSELIANRDLNAPIYDYTKDLRTNQSTINARRPRQEFQGMTSIFTGLNSMYNGMQLTMKKRFGRSYSVQGAYTWSRAIDYISKNAQVTSVNIQNPFNWGMTRGPSDNDRTHVFTGSYVWSLPTPKTVLGARWAAAVVGGWQWSGIVTLATGTPFGITSTNDAMAGAGSAFAVATGNVSLPSGRSRGAEINQWFNTAAVGQADAGTYGSLGRNVLRNPGYSNYDTRVSRVVPLKFRETANLQMLFEFFNALNHPILGAPDNRLGRTTFGQITTVSGQRVLQLGLKIGF